MLVVFASGMLCNGLLGEPILAPLKDTSQVALATIVWSVYLYNTCSTLYFVKSITYL